jgi:hypothetical protein
MEDMPIIPAKAGNINRRIAVHTNPISRITRAKRDRGMA